MSAITAGWRYEGGHLKKTFPIQFKFLELSLLTLRLETIDLIRHLIDGPFDQSLTRENSEYSKIVHKKIESKREREKKSRNTKIARWEQLAEKGVKIVKI